MKKIFILLLTVLLLTVGVLIWRFGKAEGIKIGRSQVTIKDVCVDPESGGMSANFETGEYYEIVKCKVNVRNDIRVQDVFEPEGDWDVCDDQGNCKPAARDGRWVE